MVRLLRADGPTSLFPLPMVQGVVSTDKKHFRMPSEGDRARAEALR